MIFNSLSSLLKRKKSIKDIYQRLTTSLFVKTEELAENSEIKISTGCVYSDQTELILYLKKVEGAYFLTDNGRTRTRLEKTFELKSNDVIKSIKDITEYYSISRENKQLSLKIDTLGDYTDGFLRMVYCIGFLDSMEIFYINQEKKGKINELHNIFKGLTFESFFYNITPHIKSSIDFKMIHNYHANDLEEVYSIQETSTGIILSDNGRTIANLEDIYEINELDVVSDIFAILRHFNMQKKNNAFTCLIDTSKDVVPQILHFLQGIHFLYGMKLFYNKEAEL